MFKIIKKGPPKGPYGSLLSLWIPIVPMVPYCPYGSLLSLRFPIVPTVPYCPYSSLLSLWFPIVPMDPYCPYRSLLSLWFPVVLMVPYCPYGSLMSLWFPIVPDPSCPGSILSWIPIVHVQQKISVLQKMDLYMASWHIYRRKIDSFSIWFNIFTISRSRNIIFYCFFKDLDFSEKYFSKNIFFYIYFLFSCIFKYK